MLLRLALGKSPLTLPLTTMIGALTGFISSAEPKHFQPMPPNFGIIPPLAKKVRNKRDRYGLYRDRAFTDLHTWAIEQGLCLIEPPSSEFEPAANRPSAPLLSAPDYSLAK